MRASVHRSYLFLSTFNMLGRAIYYVRCKSAGGRRANLLIDGAQGWRQACNIKQVLGVAFACRDTHWISPQTAGRTQRWVVLSPEATMARPIANVPLSFCDHGRGT